MKRTLFFADLSYINEGREWTIIPFPLNVGYIAAYVEKREAMGFPLLEASTSANG